MAEIYFRDAKGRKVSVEVSDEIAEVMTEYRRAEWRGNANAKNHNVSLQALDEVGFSPRDYSLNPLEMLIEYENQREYMERRKQLKKALKGLLPEQRKLIVLLYVERLTLKEIAEILGITYQAVQDRRNKILKKLKKYFD